MAQIDGLLKVLVQQGGDTLELEPDAAPRMLRQGAEINLFFPATSAKLHQSMLQEVQELGGPETFVHQVETLPPFQLRWGSPGPSSIRARLRAESPSRPAKPSGVEVQVEEAVNAALRQTGHGGQPPELAQLMELAGMQSASDIHLQEGESVVLRVNGNLVSSSLSAPSLQEIFPEQCAQDHADFVVQHTDGSRFRVHMYDTERGKVAAMRRLPARPPELNMLNLPVPVNTFGELRRGLILCCGPTGSGKSTTLAALAQEALRRTKGLLVTLEDPIEYLYSTTTTGGLVRQRELGAHIPSFAHGLRDALRADPDILLIGEMRDPETIQMAITAAETGHLVLSTIHAPSSAAAIERIVDSYPPERQRQIRVQLAQCMKVILSQRLLPNRAGGGRVPAVEVLRNSYAIAALIRDGRTAQLYNAMHTGAENGCLTLESCLARMVRSGVITRKVGQDASNDEKAFLSLF